VTVADLTPYQRFIKKYFADHPGTTMEKAANAWNNRGSGGGGGKPRKRNACPSDLVPTADGSAVTTRGGGHLRASVEGHMEVVFDQGALGAIWSGIVERLRSDGGANLAALFPDLYPTAAAMMRMDRQHADNRAIGVQMAPILGAVIVAYRITPEEWAGWYAAAVNQRFVIPAERGTCVTVSAALAPAGGLPAGLPADALNQANQFGGVLGAPGGAVLPGTPQGGAFGALR
jgi:hypothetical protein